MLKFLLLSFIFLGLTFGFDQNSPKIESQLLKSLSKNGRANIFVEMSQDTDGVLQNVGSQFDESTTHGERATSVYNALKIFSEESQGGVLGHIRMMAPSSPVTSFWISNTIYVKNADLRLVQSLARFSEVGSISEEPVGHIRNVYFEETNNERSFVMNSTLLKQSGPEWGLRKMKVPEVWNLGNRGRGIRFGNIDTGARATHELLKDKWVGINDFGWYDPEKKSQNPSDRYDHGTHTIGTNVGDGGMGVAPDARWMACKGYRDDGSSVASEFLSCMEFMACPTDYRGQNRNCAKAAHVVSNSWGSTRASYFNRAVNAWITAKILSSFSAGNTGPECSTIYSPANHERMIAVGASDSADNLANFSSRGPGTNRQIKPEITAPGVNVKSASSRSDNSYRSISGTSMSCPNASGVLALMKAHDMNLSHERALEILKETSQKIVRSRGSSCGGVRDSNYPNNHAGYGIVDALAAVRAI